MKEEHEHIGVGEDIGSLTVIVDANRAESGDWTLNEPRNAHEPAQRVRDMAQLAQTCAIQGRHDAGEFRGLQTRLRRALDR